MTVVHTLAHVLSPWQSTYSDSKVVSTAVTSVHLIALLFSGGLAIAADRATLLALRGSPGDRRRQLAALRDVHGPVLIALAILFASGVLLAAADVETFVSSPIFWGKLALVALLVVNGWVLQRTETKLRQALDAELAPPSLWRRLRASTWLSIALWAATTLAGATLVGAA
ncbi:MAG TPA: hypothetical protein VNS52_07485 [Gemmatimonadaceae bacterium]|nr:hypothetical protein [Gemmatimonadaceae bacterium]